jgi:hypothetical protein
LKAHNIYGFQFSGFTADIFAISFELWANRLIPDTWVVRDTRLSGGSVGTRLRPDTHRWPIIFQEP